MTRNEVVKLAKKLGWKPWGKLRPYKNGSLYQCFRRGNNYAWIGNYFAEVGTKATAQDFVRGTHPIVRKLFLS